MQGRVSDCGRAATAHHTYGISGICKPWEYLIFINTSSSLRNKSDFKMHPPKLSRKLATMHWRGRRSGGGRDGGDDATSASSAGEMRRRKRLGMRGLYVAIFFTALLPSLVAGQTMECTNTEYVKGSTETVAKLNSYAKGTGVTFTENVRGHFNLLLSFISFILLNYVSLPQLVHLHCTWHLLVLAVHFNPPLSHTPLCPSHSFPHFNFLFPHYSPFFNTALIFTSFPSPFGAGKRRPQICKYLIYI